jgi:arylsulfatase A-like enzyme
LVNGRKLTILLVCAVCLASLLARVGFRQLASSEQPLSVLLLVVDSLRSDHVGAYGYHRDTTPFIDELSEQGVLFKTVIAPSSWTKTSMPSILASLSPEAHGVRGVRDVLPEEVVLLPEILKASGYRNACFHSNPWMDTRFGFNQGYDAFVVKDFMKHDPQVLNQLALEWLEENRPHRFFLYMHYMDVHWPYRPDARHDIFGEGLVDKYDGGILTLDTRLRSFFDALRERGFLENTLIVMTSDHGEEFFEHGGVSHGKTLYQEVLTIPLLFIHDRVIPRGTTVYQQARGIDISPTILDLAGIEIPPYMDGVSLKDDVMQEVVTRDDLEAISQVGLNDVARRKDLLAITTPRWKYIFDAKDYHEELYDLLADPGEKVDLSWERQANIEAARRRVMEFRAQHSGHRAAAGQTRIDAEMRDQLKALGYLQ